jgi:hypothetical protein
VKETSTGEAKIVTLTLPTQATGIVAGTASDPAFKHFTALKAVSGTGVTSIGADAFNNCATLTSVSIPAATTTGTAAFSLCAALTSVTIPKSLSLQNFNNAQFGGSNNKIVWTLA